MATMTGTSSSDTIVAGSGDDVINSGNGDDVIDGGTGNDTLRGGAGNDTLVYVLSDNLSAEGSDDLYVGGSGIDTVRLVLTEAEYLAIKDQLLIQMGEFEDAFTTFAQSCISFLMNAAYCSGVLVNGSAPSAM